MLIQVDVDSTLYDADKLFGSIAKERGIKWLYRYPRWFGPEELGCSRADMKNIFRAAHSKEYVMQQTPYPGAVETLRNLVEDFDNIEVVYISDRNEAQGKALREWLEVNDFLHSEDQHVMATKDKRVWMRQHRPDVVIDDRVRTLVLAATELGAHGVSLEHPHNINLRNEVPNIHIVEDWNGIDKVLREVVIPATLVGRDTVRG